MVEDKNYDLLSSSHNKCTVFTTNNHFLLDNPPSYLLHQKAVCCDIILLCN